MVLATFALVDLDVSLTFDWKALGLLDPDSTIRARDARAVGGPDPKPGA